MPPILRIRKQRVFQLVSPQPHHLDLAPTARSGLMSPSFQPQHVRSRAAPVDWML